jgi:hypothetical protein
MRREQMALAAIAMAAAAACGPSTAGGPASTSSVAVTAPSDAEVATVRLATDESDAVIRGSGDAGYRVERIVHYGGPEPPPSHRLEGRTLVLEGCELPDCWFEYEVTVPSSVDVTGEAGSGSTNVYGTAEVDVRAGSGSVSVTSVAGPVRIDAGSGAILLDGIGGDLTVTAGSGSVRGSGLSGARTQAETGSGDVDLEFDAASAVQAIEATSGSGDVSLVVPPGRYRVTVESNGPPEIDVDIDPAAPATIDVSSDSGEVSVVAAS